jgi:hypothetical protein
MTGTWVGRKKKIQNASKPDIYHPEYSFKPPLIWTLSVGLAAEDFGKDLL